MWWQLIITEGDTCGCSQRRGATKKSDSDSSENHNALKSAYRGLYDSCQSPSPYVKTQYGYSQESLPTWRQLLQNVHTRKMQQLTLLSALQERTPKIRCPKLKNEKSPNNADTKSMILHHADTLELLSS